MSAPSCESSALPGARARVLIVEDDRLVALDLESMLRDFGFSPCSTAHSAEEALRVATDQAPELVLMDIRLEGEADGVWAAQHLRDQLGLRVIYLTANSDLSTVERAKATEPCGYLLKPIRPLDLRCCLELALDQVRRERSTRPSQPKQSSPVTSGDKEPLAKLSGRELEVLTLIARGHTSKDIAQTLHIGKPTVDTYRSRLTEKLGVRSRTELVSIANRAGLLEPQASDELPDGIGAEQQAAPTQPSRDP
jgi:DNA-binding NarL/FixJ family response regulator